MNQAVIFDKGEPHIDVLKYDWKSLWSITRTRLKKVVESKSVWEEKARFIQVYELKWIQVELFSFLHFMCTAANASESFCIGHLANIENFL